MPVLKFTIQTFLFACWGWTLISLVLLSSFTFFLFNICLASFMFWFLVTLGAWILFIVPFLKFIYLPYRKRQWQEWTAMNNAKISMAFFHPYCNDGGGGERVLWTAIDAITKNYKDIRIVVYTGDCDYTPERILQRVRERFDMNLNAHSISFIYLKTRWLVEAKYYKMFTLLGQSVGSILLGLEALLRFVPDIYFDSMGYAFTYPLFRYIGSSKVLCYVHYPTISTDMLERVTERRITYNNRGFISNNIYLSKLKLYYYKLFAYIYGLCGKCSELTYVNSSWTKQHINQIWSTSNRTHLVYPPCDVQSFLAMPLYDDNKRQFFTIVSVGQFRPEKDHELQIRSFHDLLQRIPERRSQLRLLLIGSCRHEDDRQRVESLRTLVDNLNLNDVVEFKLNIKFDELKTDLNQAMIGLHTMWNEHFGIGIVEMMAAGTIVLAHNSGGPKMDIVDNQTGFLAHDLDSYATKMRQIIELSNDERLRLDHRRPFSLRPADIEFRQEYGSVVVRIGRTRVLAQTSCKIVKPKETRPNEGRLRILLKNIHLLSFSFDAGRQSQWTTTLSRHLLQNIQDSRCVDMESLCIVAYEHVRYFFFVIASCYHWDTVRG
ncbi:unnamed protein product [Didymodactylos carnosus]|uniref:GDP-Man:Man(3)GlcNAc(2)-PP-Dol alpha-1,2-mannosyltransferase n=1 Tax=Didymodactylos carnosus TaxID=1234261 RepID=A0A8S2NAY0_9BILA|nr:unnamed protein product [Didymodactylos carnosus]CAF3996894.1 unnamed protein product [Didymodactylos carnosus]